jgi:N-acetylglucosamine kinase-like BadF-type ATPase
MTETGVILGIDGGGTSTVCVVADRSGHVLSIVEAPPSNHRKADLREAREALVKGIGSAMHAAGFPEQRRPQFAAVCAGLAGVDTREDAALLRQLLSDVVSTEHLQVLNDGEIALAGALEDEPGVLVISGTGSIAWATSVSGEHLRVGGWDYILGDEGSGYNIGSRVLRAVACAHDRRIVGTCLTESVFNFFEVTDFDGLLGVIYHEEMTPQRIASLAPLADRAAIEGDEAAAQLLRGAARDLASLALSAASLAKLDTGSFPVVGMGGVLLADGYFAEVFREEVRAHAPEAHFISSKHIPAEGAVRLAMRLLTCDDTETASSLHVTGELA